MTDIGIISVVKRVPILLPTLGMGQDEGSLLESSCRFGAGLGLGYEGGYCFFDSLTCGGSVEP